ncbi:MAG: type I-U CRISPR-associated protein Cas5/Cas6, partial [Burkholderiaceae bacterium]|nr:type I-U CRISPR-associated protein Cas5/Cas6 [Burkholderiaceae bacterium]
MPTLLLRFPARRYHATPWGHHVNEGLIEWPPSPWRVLRALLSVGYSACGWTADLDEPWRSSPPESARALILALAGVAPRYGLPPAVGAHSRHYMPMAEFKGGQERTTLVFDTWAQIESGELAITWDVDLRPEQTTMLGELASRLNYLGRSESWVQARLATFDESAAIQHNCLPCERTMQPGPGWEQVALLAAEDAATYSRWREAGLQQALAPLPEVAGRGKAATKREAEREAMRSMFPIDTLACLQVDTSWLLQHGWSQPPGSRKLLYWRRSDALQAPPAAHVRTQQRDAARCVLLSLASQSLNNHALPTLARSLPQAELLHRQVLGAFGKLATGRHSTVLSGCDANGKPLRGAHGHAHVLPLDLDGDEHIDHILLWAPDGLPAPEQQALRHIRSTFTKGGVGALRMAWVGAGELADFDGLAAPHGPALRRTAGSSRQWLSATPFVPPRHLKARGAHTLDGQVRAELRSRGLPEPQSVQ